mgnify:CR=1 FL=1
MSDLYARGTAWPVTPLKARRRATRSARRVRCVVWELDRATRDLREIEDRIVTWDELRKSAGRPPWKEVKDE